MINRLQPIEIKKNYPLLLAVVFIFAVQGSFSQQLPKIFSSILERDTSYIELRCNIEIEVRLPGLNMPEKKVSFIMKKGEETRIEGDGLMLLPKRGLLGQYQSILETPCQAITLMENADTVKYKLVSLSAESDWVTVDFTITKSDAKVHFLNVVTRENGVFNIEHEYEEKVSYIPETTIISFEALPMKLPLKFIAQNAETDQIFNSDKPVDGLVILKYSDVTAK